MEVVEIPMASRDLVRFPNLPDDHLLHRMQMRIVDAGEADAAVELDLAPQVSNGAGSLQGGLLATLVDVVAGRAVAATLDGPATFVTRDLSVHYLGVLGSSPVRAGARVRRRSARTVVVQVDVQDGCGSLGAVATLSFAVRPLGPAAPEESR